MPPHLSTPEILARFDRSDPDGCWPYMGCRNPRGYGVLTTNCVHWLAHRFVWTQTYGPIPDGMDVLHRCDNPPCGRPDHLFLGTRAENNADMVAKGRHDPQGHKKGKTLRGERHPMAKFTMEQVEMIHRLHAEGMMVKNIAVTFDVERHAISDLLRGYTYSLPKQTH